VPPRIAPRFGYRQKALARSQYIGGSLNNPHQPIERANRLVYEGVRNIGSTGQLWTHRSNSLILNLCEQLNMSTGKIRLQHYYKCRQATYKEYQHECATNLNSTVGITTRESGTGLYSKCITTMYVKLPTRSTANNSGIRYRSLLKMHYYYVCKATYTEY
jgi:hypothetical protein